MNYWTVKYSFDSNQKPTETNDGSFSIRADSWGEAQLLSIGIFNALFNFQFRPKSVIINANTEILIDKGNTTILGDEDDIENK